MELDLLFKEEKKDVVSEWDKTVPIIVKDGVVTTYLMEEIYEPSVYNELCYTLENTAAKEFRLIMNNGGGDMYAMLFIINSIKKCKAEVTAVISGNVSSAVTMITLACDKIEVAEHTSWLTHYYSGGTTGKGNEIKAKQEFDNVEMPRMFKELHKGFLTDEECERVIDAKDIWLNKEQIEERFANMKALR